MIYQAAVKAELDSVVELTEVDVRFTARKMTARLTHREEEVLRLLVLGKANKEIANELGISPRTVKFHVGNLLQKFKVTSRLELLSFWAMAQRR